MNSQKNVITLLLNIWLTIICLTDIIMTEQLKKRPLVVIIVKLMLKQGENNHDDVMASEAENGHI